MSRAREAPRPVQRLLVGLAAALLFLLVETRLAETDPWRSLELGTLDARFRLRGPIAAGGETVLVMVDDATVARLGIWPPPREAIAKAVSRIAEAGARVIALDLLFAEDHAPLPENLRALLDAAARTLPAATPLRGQIAAALEAGDPDLALAAAIRAAGRVIAPYAFVFDPRQANVAEVPAWVRATAYRVHTGTERDLASLMPAARGLLVPTPQLAGAGAAAGHVTLLLEADGSLRSELPAFFHRDDFYPSLPLEAARAWLGLPRERLMVDGRRGIALGDRFLPTDPTLRHIVNYYGPAGAFPTYSLADLLDRRLDSRLLAERIVVIGANAAGAGERFATPFAGSLPGAEFLATAIDNILHGRALVRNATTHALDALAILAFALVAALLAGRRTPLWSGLVVLLLAALWLATIQAAFAMAQIWLAGLAPILASAAAGSAVEALRLAEERRQRRRLERQRANLARYFPPAVVERLATSDAPARLDRTQPAVVMFVDIVGFTRIAESLSPAASLSLLRAFHTEVERAVFAHGGMLDKFIGDGALACFGVPDPTPTAAADAVRAAFGLIAALTRPVAGDAATVRLKVGIGIHRGPVLMGDIGGARQFQFTVVGDTVNVASRLETLTRRENTPLIVSAAAFEAARPHLAPGLLARLEPLPDLALRGREGSIAAWRLARDAVLESAPD